MNIPLNSVIVRNRQRRATDVDDLFAASVGKRLIHPIILRREDGDDSPILVVGERRLLGLQKFGLTELVENTHFRFLDNLSPTEAQMIELEENVKRTDLPWRDHIVAVATLDKIYRQQNPEWNTIRVAEELNIDKVWLSRFLIVSKNLNSPLLTSCGSVSQAISILENMAERRLASIIGDISQAGNNIFGDQNASEERNDEDQDSNLDQRSEENSGETPGESNTEPERIPNVARKKVPLAVLSVDFSNWIKTYSGPKFTLIHCDFPYDIKYDSYAKSVTSSTEDYDSTGFWPLLNVLCDNIEKIASYQSHVMFWFSMKFYQKTKDRLSSCGLFVHDHPLIWDKTDNAGIIPGVDGTYPRRVYETAFLCSRGKRPLVKPLANAYGAPTASKPVHPSQKPEPVLRHFFGMLVDDTTDVLDPTCGSGTALRAAEDLGARSVLGLELDLKYAETAEALTQTARTMRRIHQ